MFEYLFVVIQHGVFSGWLRTESFTKQGRLNTKIKMIALVSIPILIMIIIASYFTASNVMLQVDNNSVRVHCCSWSHVAPNKVIVNWMGQCALMAGVARFQLII